MKRYTHTHTHTFARRPECSYTLVVLFLTREALTHFTLTDDGETVYHRAHASVITQKHTLYTYNVCVFTSYNLFTCTCVLFFRVAQYTSQEKKSHIMKKTHTQTHQHKNTSTRTCTPGSNKRFMCTYFFHEYSCIHSSILK